MANARIIQINGGTPITRLRNTNDVMELDNSALGSAQINVTNVTGGQLLDYATVYIDPATLTVGSSSIYNIGYNSGFTPLPSTPSRIDISIMCTSGNQFVIFGNVIADTINTTGFSVALSAPVPNSTSHKLIWKAYA